MRACAGSSVRSVRPLVGRAAEYGWHQAWRLRNRRFQTKMRAAAQAPAVVLSPHLDDAVIDCWSVLSSPASVTVVNVFAGVPSRDSLVHWDRLCGADRSAVFVECRLAEDREALQLVGREPVNLPLLAKSYRRPHQAPTFRRLDAALTRELQEVSLVYAPAVLGTVHPDHLLVRSYALALARSGVPVQLYADLPYAVTFGWPHWVTEESPDPHLDVDVHWQATAARLPSVGERERAHVVRLSSKQAQTKLAAIRTYRTQFPMLNRGPIGLLTNPKIHGFEVFWPLAAEQRSL